MLDTPLPHVVPLEGGSNFRDLGGYRTAEGHFVRRGAVLPPVLGAVDPEQQRDGVLGH